MPTKTQKNKLQRIEQKKYQDAIFEKKERARKALEKKELLKQKLQKENTKVSPSELKNLNKLKRIAKEKLGNE